MALRGKLGLTLIAIVLLLLVWMFVPSVTNESWPAFFKDLVTEYNEAAERASNHGDDDDDDDDEQEADSAPAMTVILDDEAIDYAGVDTLPVSEKIYYPELQAYASVVDIRSLIQWRSRINQLESAVEIAHVKEASSRKELERLRKLAKNTGSVASKNVLYADAAWQEARANLQAAKIELEDTNAELIQSWGSTIADWVRQNETKQFERLISREDSLLLVSLPVEHTLPAEIASIQVSVDGGRENTVEAYYVSPAYASSQQVQGETYYFRVSSDRLRLGMRLDAWIPQSDEPLKGFQIPERAIVWYAGQPWTYVQQDEATYKRRPLAAGQSVADGIFIESGFTAGERLVISGSQMLLSEEFRWQIHDEDDD